jgi:hypothetical protein
LIDRIPVLGSVNETNARNGVLKEFGAAIVVAMGMGQKDVFDFADIQSKLLHAVDDLVLGGIVEQRFENDDTVAAGDGPRVVNLRADEIEVVGDFGGFCVPRLFRRRPLRRPARPSWCGGGCGGRCCRRRRRNAKAEKGSRPVEAGRVLCLADEVVDGRRSRLCGQGANTSREH